MKGTVSFDTLVAGTRLAGWTGTANIITRQAQFRDQALVADMGIVITHEAVGDLFKNNVKSVTPLTV
jgi:peroxiredoxin